MEGHQMWVGMPGGPGETSGLCFRLQRNLPGLSHRGKRNTSVWGAAVSSPAFREPCRVMERGSWSPAANT